MLSVMLCVLLCIKLCILLSIMLYIMLCITLRVVMCYFRLCDFMLSYAALLRSYHSMAKLLEQEHTDPWRGPRISLLSFIWRLFPNLSKASVGIVQPGRRVRFKVVALMVDVHQVSLWDSPGSHYRVSALGEYSQATLDFDAGMLTLYSSHDVWCVDPFISLYMVINISQLLVIIYYSVIIYYANIIYYLVTAKDLIALWPSTTAIVLYSQTAEAYGLAGYIVSALSRHCFQSLIQEATLILYAIMS